MLIHTIMGDLYMPTLISMRPKKFLLVCFCCNGRWLKIVALYDPNSLLSLVIYTSKILVYFTCLNKDNRVASVCPIVWGRKSFLWFVFVANGRWLKIVALCDLNSLLSLVIYTSTILVYFTWLNKASRVAGVCLIVWGRQSFLWFVFVATADD
jgi:galactose mutarotase-like enzyme